LADKLSVSTNTDSNFVVLLKFPFLSSFLGIKALPSTTTMRYHKKGERREMHQQKNRVPEQSYHSRLESKVFKKKGG
jgi:hypothetical protein